MFRYSQCIFGIRENTVDDARIALRILDGRVEPGGEKLHVGFVGVEKAVGQPIMDA
jgi:hypothetical protein